MPRIKLVIFDMDGTLVQYGGPFNSSWDGIGYAAAQKGLLNKEEWDNYTDYYYPKRRLYGEWLRTNARLLKGVKISDIEKIIFPLPYAEGVKDVVFKLKRFCSVGLLSSGVDIIAKKIKEELGLDFHMSNVLEVTGGTMTGKGRVVVNLWKKDEIVKKIIKERKLKKEEVCFVGDHENDVCIFKHVGLGIAVFPKSRELEENAHFIAKDFYEVYELIKKYNNL